MRDLVRLIVLMVADLFRPRAALETEIWMLRQQINVLRRTAPKKQTFSSIDRLIFVCLYRLRPGVREALAIVKPETVVKWHRSGFRLYWRWKSKARGGRPTVPLEIRKLIREMSIANSLWGAPRIHGELLKLGIDIGQTSVAKYMVKRRGPKRIFDVVLANPLKKACAGAGEADHLPGFHALVAAIHWIGQIAFLGICQQKFEESRRFQDWLAEGPKVDLI